MNTRAPELRALIIILRSTGPVISTRLSLRSAGGGATCQSPSRTTFVSGRKSGSAPASSSLLARGPELEQLAPPGAQLALQQRHERERVGGEDLRVGRSDDLRSPEGHPLAAISN